MTTPLTPEQFRRGLSVYWQRHNLGAPIRPGRPYHSTMYLVVRRKLAVQIAELDRNIIKNRRTLAGVITPESHAEKKQVDELTTMLASIITNIEEEHCELKKILEEFPAKI